MKTHNQSRDQIWECIVQLLMWACIVRVCVCLRVSVSIWLCLEWLESATNILQLYRWKWGYCLKKKAKLIEEETAADEMRQHSSRGPTAGENPVDDRGMVAQRGSVLTSLLTGPWYQAWLLRSSVLVLSSSSSSFFRASISLRPPNSCGRTAQSVSESVSQSHV